MKTLVTLLLSLLIAPVYSQISLSFGGFYSSPLEHFCEDDYQDGAGFTMGISYLKNIDSTFALEFGFDGEWGKNHGETASLGIGEYELSNHFSDWKFKINLIKEFGSYRPYIGFHVGAGSYYTQEYLDFNEIQNDGSNFYQDELYSTRVDQYGMQLGTYIKLNDYVFLNFGVTVNKSDSKVKFINYESYTFDGSSIDYNETHSRPYMILLNGGVTFRFKPVVHTYNGTRYTDDDYIYSDSDYYYDDSSYDSSYTYSTGSTSSGSSSSSGSCSGSSSSSSSSSSSDSGSSSSDSHYKNNSTPKLIKNGKTPVGYK